MLGNYCCSETPGRFYWTNGAILQAMLDGDWLLLEDIDQSNPDVLSALGPLLETRSLLVPGLGNSKVVAKNNFRVFATSRFDFKLSKLLI
ncbi:hypothetical protein HELRODRAFT_82685 [Helobdella robusta]|uniref:ATPase dynein-related AAA domain-containing protein n=1 Tax=Helobdella robusta TaxID=6412 RepID=T1G4V3_HELRO|nr:hypothetical protein HELRODRAFT_82685 [Helobdella robusta]ESO00904.1 hypothetical protein HELRODRAFT_82685 [Helobdella robusta]